MGRAFRVSLQNMGELKDVLGKFDQYDTATQEKLRSVVEESTKNILFGARKRIHSISTELVKSTSMTYDREKNIGIIRAKSPKAHLVERGHKGAIIQRKNKRALATPYGPKKRVRTGDAQPHPFMVPAGEDEKQNLIKNAQEALKP